VVLYDLFTERAQFEWMLNVLLEVFKIHPVEDEVLSQYIIVGICKAGAITGMVSLFLQYVW